MLKSPSCKSQALLIYNHVLEYLQYYCITDLQNNIFNLQALW